MFYVLFDGTSAMVEDPDHMEDEFETLCSFLTMDEAIEFCDRENEKIQACPIISTHY